MAQGEELGDGMDGEQKPKGNHGALQPQRRVRNTSVPGKETVK